MQGSFIFWAAVHIWQNTTVSVRRCRRNCYGKYQQRMTKYEHNCLLFLHLLNVWPIKFLFACREKFSRLATLELTLSSVHNSISHLPKGKRKYCFCSESDSVFVWFHSVHNPLTCWSRSIRTSELWQIKRTLLSESVLCRSGEVIKGMEEACDYGRK